MLAWAFVATLAVLLGLSLWALRMVNDRAMMWYGAYNDMKTSYRTKINRMEADNLALTAEIQLAQADLAAAVSKMQAMGLQPAKMLMHADGTWYAQDYYIREEP